ncbi:EFR1 family ferrodoxin [Acetobacterium woodii]|uniref:Ferredoxin n=1 Tax=Acetobacterium woodii (strain ATCC 29683 / DSM 1030 / JCM 2381 / KCTC 1655 / WB1) TaxID=931626 RepID=H6LKW0_ACEWD|nr:EFR1 family ferrodoxin [Acetobacterium woodii]AFA50069.1 4Fe-4S ferredoxin iron-sulfur binding protein [Acetobacterium woodii DSM 1030]
MFGTQINFYYYSGTGNTLLVVKEMIEIFSAKGISVTLHKIEETDPQKIDTTIPFGIAFPVAFQSTLPFVCDFFKALPRADKTPVFMVDTMMAFSGAIVGPLKKVLTEKGYDCIGACEIVMPNNWLPKQINEEVNGKKINSGLEKARAYAENLIKGNTSWKRIPFLSKGFYHLCCNHFIMERVNLAEGRKITVDQEKCIKCGLCAKLCPVNNIKMKDYPEWHKSCELCMRCLSFCPANAVIIPGKKFKQYRVVKAKELIKKNIK